jgi:two-component system sensor histidine kinase TctE
MLAEAVENLLDNAGQYGCANGGEVTVEVIFAEAEVLLRVADSGEALPQDMRDRVFDRFVRLNDDSLGGCGLGLAIVRKVAEAHGGRVEMVAHNARTAVELRVPLGQV